MKSGPWQRAVKSTRSQLLVTLAASLVSVGFLAARGLPPEQNLFDAAATGDEAQVRRALNWGAAADMRNRWGQTPLHMVFSCAPKEVARLLITHGADIDAMDVSGETPLHMAVNYGRNDLADLLRQYGAKWVLVVPGGPISSPEP